METSEILLIIILVLVVLVFIMRFYSFVPKRFGGGATETLNARSVGNISRNNIRPHIINTVFDNGVRSDQKLLNQYRYGTAFAQAHPNFGFERYNSTRYMDEDERAYSMARSANDNLRRSFLPHLDVGNIAAAIASQKYGN